MDFGLPQCRLLTKLDGLSLFFRKQASPTLQVFCQQKSSLRMGCIQPILFVNRTHNRIPLPDHQPFGFNIPYLGGAILDYSLRLLGNGNSPCLCKEVLWTYCHPWEFDKDEKYYQLDHVGRLTSRIAWIGRSGMENKMRNFLRDTQLPL